MFLARWRFAFTSTWLEGNNSLVKNVTRALVDKLVVKFAGTVLQEMAGYDIYKTFRTFSFQRKRETAWGLREYRVKAYARSALAQITRKPRASLLKAN